MLSNIKITKRDVAFIVILTILFLCRIIMLDNDVPAWDISLYQPIDEAFYCNTAFNWTEGINYNSFIELSGELSKVWQTDVSLITNVFVFISLSIFGKTYFGLRMAAVLASIIIYILLIAIMKKLSNRNKVSRFGFYFTLIYFICDFTFLMASRVVEPTIFRAMWLLIISYLFIILKEKQKCNFFIMGFLSVSGLFLVYLTNAFVFLANGVALLWLILNKGKKEKVKTILIYCIGCILGLIVSNVLMELLLDKSIIDLVSSIGGQMGDRVTMSSDIIQQNITDIFTSNVFLYNPITLILAVSTILLGVYIYFKTKNINYIFINSLVIGLIMQSTITSDFVFRKFIVVFPIILLNIFICFNEWKLIKNVIISNKKIFNVIKITLLMYLSYRGFEELYLRMATIGSINDSTKEMYIVGLIVTVVCIPILYILFSSKKYKIACALLILLSITQSLIFSFKYVYTYRYFSERDIMVDIGEIVGDDAVIGGYPQGYRLYNNIKPVLSSYDKYLGEGLYNGKINELLKDDQVNYYIGYDNMGNTLKDLNIQLENTKYEFKLVKEYERTYSKSVPSEDIVLLKKEIREER